MTTGGNWPALKPDIIIGRDFPAFEPSTQCGVAIDPDNGERIEFWNCAEDIDEWRHKGGWENTNRKHVNGWTYATWVCPGHRDDVWRQGRLFQV